VAGRANPVCRGLEAGSVPLKAVCKSALRVDVGLRPTAGSLPLFVRRPSFSLPLFWEGRRSTRPVEHRRSTRWIGIDWRRRSANGAFGSPSNAPPTGRPFGPAPRVRRTASGGRPCRRRGFSSVNTRTYFKPGRPSGSAPAHRRRTALGRCGCNASVGRRRRHAVGRRIVHPGAGGPVRPCGAMPPIPGWATSPSCPTQRAQASGSGTRRRASSAGFRGAACSLQ
jgi:hypothetical protein